MKITSICTLVVSYLTIIAQAQTPPASLHGTVTDPSGALVPGALVQLRGPGPEQRSTTDDNGKYSFATLRAGSYNVRVIAKGFTVGQKQNIDINSPLTLDMQLTIEAESQVVNVEETAGQITTDPGSNSDALVLHAKELEALSDDPDELAQQLQAMAGPASGPNGGQIYIDGFTGGNLPPKSSIREIRVNSNPYAPEFDRPGFGRIEILTKPGTDTIRGQVFFQFNNQDFNSRSALFRQPDLPPYKQIFEGFNISGPIKKNKASFGLDFERRDITENALVIATIIGPDLNPVSVNQGVVTPQTRMTIAPRLDYTINDKNTLVARFQNTRIGQDDNGVGGYNLVGQAYNTTNQENTLQLTETAVLSAKLINETRFQYQHVTSTNLAASTAPQINVPGSFVSGGSAQGNFGSTQNNYELTNNTTYIAGTHSLKFGTRLRESSISSTTMSNFNGSYTFLGGTGPQLDGNDQPIAGTSIPLTALDVYQRTLIGQQQGLTDAQIRSTLGGGATQFQLGAGTPTLGVRQFDIGLYANDDWRMRPNLTLSLGLRYENQTNISDHGNFAPRVGVAWGVDAHGNTPAKTILRGGFGIFYDRIALNSTLNSELYNGITQQSYFLMNPAFFPLIPPTSALTKSPQQLQYLYEGIVAPRSYQASLSVERTINKYARISAQYLSNRGVHLTRALNINAPINGVYPYGDPSLRELTEANGLSRTNQFIVSPNVNFKKFFLFGFYSFSHGKDDNEGAPADPYNLHAEWGPSTFADVRHRAVIGTNIPLPWQISISPFLIMNSGTPYNITTGIDANGDGVAAERPSLAVNVPSGSCTGKGFAFEAGYGCFNLNPAPGTAIERNYGRGPASETLMLRIARTWSFGNREGAQQMGPGGQGGPGGPGGPGGGGPPPGGGGGGPRGGPGGGGGGGGPMIMMGGGGGSAGKKYSLTASVQAANVFNHTNFGPPVGNLSSPYFGESTTLASGFGPPGAGGGGAPTYNRKITLQMRFTF